MTTTTTRRTVRTPHGVARLTLHISGVCYTVRPIPSPDGRAWSLRKAAGVRHDITETPHGPTCSCGDFLWRRDGLDPQGCKHLRAMRAVGLLASQSV